MGKIKLNVLGISYSQTQSGAYALVLSEEDGNRRIPIIVGGFEAQAIAIELEGLAPPRPLTHDLFKNFAESYSIKIIEVNIHKLEDGVFFANILCDNGGQRITLDARTSDAIALALRFSCPIYTTETIVEKAGIVLDFEKGNEFENPDIPPPEKDLDIQSEDPHRAHFEGGSQGIHEVRFEAVPPGHQVRPRHGNSRWQRETKVQEAR